MTRPAGLHTLVLDIRVATGKLAAGDIAQLGATINPFAFQQVSASGITTPAQASTCKATSQRQLPANWAPNSKYSGQLALDVPEANGVLALIPSGMSAPGGGWEWQY
ncbi:hypothetical protein SAMN05421504_106172 [Amycolatopsis xylanica]|uniref:Uncharacterized protein n=2 Tax=Amycolatopsis xylanica TaxID=589385 RepID=A0A1H3LDG6_9PSEU|nr:hypothetical protein SAMN05421504_106172 [Amycolatopsis xylanica]